MLQLGNPGFNVRTGHFLRDKRWLQTRLARRSMDQRFTRARSLQLLPHLTHGSLHLCLNHLLPWLIPFCLSLTLPWLITLHLCLSKLTSLRKLTLPWLIVSLSKLILPWPTFLIIFSPQGCRKAGFGKPNEKSSNRRELWPLFSSYFWRWKKGVY